VCKLAGRSKAWFSMLGKYVRAPRERMHFVMIPIEKTLDAPAQQLLPMDVVDALVDRAHTAAVIHQCMCRVGGRCADYPTDVGCLVLGRAAQSLDPRIGRIVSKDEAKAHIKTALSRGLYPLISHYERDSMMFGLDFDRMLIVCFCCPCHCVARNAGRASEGLEHSFYENCVKFPSVEVSFDASRCTGCGKCASQCFANAITFADGAITFAAEKCKGCGHCAYICDAYSVAYNVRDVDSVIEQLAITGDIS
jgi:ferredoxin